MDEGLFGCQKPSHNLEESRPVRKAARKSSGITDRAESSVRAHERADLSTLLYELIRALTLKATWSPVSVPRGRKCCNEDNL